MAHIIRPVDMSSPIKIEVGSGGAPVPGYVHVDVDPGMPDLHAVCKMGDEPLPYPDNCASEILSNHSCEHVSWLKAGDLFSDWLRVLIPGGRLFFRTPDLEFICKTYLAGKFTKEHPVDEGNMLRIFGEYGPAHWANIKLFAGQNYSGNFHLYCLDWDLAQQILTKTGFVNIRRLDIKPVYSPGELQVEAFKKA